MAKVVVKVKCVNCGMKKDIHAGEVGLNDFPMCNKCFMPMVPIKAEKK